MRSSRWQALALLALAVSAVPVVSGRMPGAVAAEPFQAEGRALASSALSDSVTTLEFFATCPRLPATQGLDAWIFELPAGLESSNATATVTASNQADDYDLEIAEYGSGAPTCTFTPHVDPASRDVTATLKRGTRFLSVLTRSGGTTTFHLTVTPSSGPPPPERPPFPFAPRRSYPLTPDDPIYNTPAPEVSYYRPAFTALHESVGQWNMRKIEAPQAWQLPQATGRGVVVAVIDSGIDLEHEDFQCPGKLDVVPGSNLGSEHADPDRPDDVKGHGTHVAGIVAACTHNGTGVVGVAPDATLMPVRIVATNGATDGSALADAIRFAADNGAHVVNMSLQSLAPWSLVDREASTSLYAEQAEAVRYAQSKGVVVVAAAGNLTLPFCMDPAMVTDVICVGATGRSDEPAYYSNWAGKASDAAAAVMAPGGSGLEPCSGDARDIVSTFLPPASECDSRPNYAVLSGTSMASPHVAGVAALVYDRLAARRSSENARRVIDAVLHTADDLLVPGYDVLTGYGRVNARKAVESVALVPETAPTTLAFLPGTPASGQFSDVARMGAQLVDSQGAPLAGKPVSFVFAGVDDTLRATARTDAAGVARVDVPLTARPGEYEVTVAYVGESPGFGPSHATAPFTIAREDSGLDALITGRGSNTRIVATLTDADSAAPIAGASVTLVTDDRPPVTSVTGADGRAVFDVAPGKRHRLAFAGDDRFLPTAAEAHR